MAKADKKDSIEKTIDETIDEKMLSSITSTCKTLTQAPSTVTTSLGHLLLISARQDFSLKECCPNAKFQYIKFPDSFRACLVQISNGVCDAFYAAHRSMNRISVKSEHIATYAKAALELMEKGTDPEWRIALHRLQNAKESCQECVEAAASIAEEFEKVGKVTNELQEALIGTEGETKFEEKSTRNKIEEARKKMERITESEKNLDEKWNEAKKEYAAVASLSPWKIMLCEFIDSVSHLPINLTIESLKEAVGPQMQMSTPNLELGRHGGPFTEALKGEYEERKREKKVKYDECTTNRNEAKETLKESKENASKDLEKFNQRINDINNIKEVLQHSMEKFYWVKTFWRELNTMFETFHDLIKERIEKNVSNALECGEVMNEELRDGQEMPKITGKQIIADSKNARKVACIVKWISRFYVEVSNKYLLVGVDGLHSISLLESTDDHARMEELWRKLEEDAKEAEREIPKLAEERKEDLRN
ncbi:uncharacterized protein LOC114527688 [Dendronephthya gigantea]|uniref:uncharacterized protein LOC114527688 n=1 Tax=Dendronephthya gigantea TaxID=151771 RepID=UPI001068D645|nr:uncharacterized protein LOC114527688 [Dendronephthya gigantea]